MATTVGSHSVSTFATPVNGGPLDANVVRGNDNTIRSAYVAHDADTGIHVQSSTLANRPAAGTAGRKWITADTGIFKLWYDDGTTWHEVGTSTIDVYVRATENLVKGDIVKVTGYNVGNGAPEVAKVSSAADVAFGIVNQTIASGSVGYITNTGLIIDLNTNAFATGDILYPNTSGGLTTTKPTSGNYQPVAFVLRSNSNNGVLYVEFSAPRIVERSDNTASTVVLRDASGNFSAGTITAGALTSTGLVTFASLKGTGATTVTNIINDGTMATASATTLATSASIKTYVDTQIGANNDLSEVLVNGNSTGSRDIVVTAGQKITTDTIAETTLNAGVTIDSVLLKDDVVNATDIETGTISANDGTQAATIANSTGVMTIASSVLTTTDINGGTVDGTTIGASVPAAATFTNITSAGTINLTGATVSNGGSVTTIDINGGTIDGTTIGGASPAAGTFTTINATDINATTFDMTNLEVTNIKAKDGTASITIADTSGNVTFSKDLIANGNITLGNATSDTITVGGSFPTGTKLRTDSGVGNTLAVSAYDVDGTAYVDLITATASNTPTLALTSTGVGSMNNIAIGGTTPAAGAFTTLGSSGDFAVATNKFTVASATGNTAVAGTLTTEGTLTSNGNTVLGNAATDTITATAQFVTGTQLKSAQSANNTLALSAYDVDGTAYVDLVKLTAGNTPTLTLTSTGTGSMDNITIGGSTAAAGSFTSLSASGNFTLGADVVLSRGAANRLDLASGDSMNVVSGDYQIAGTSVLSSNTLGSGVTASSLTSVGTLTSLTVSGDLTVDTSTLKVDSANNRVGVGTASPEAQFVVSASTAGGEGGYIYLDNPSVSTLGSKAGIKFATSSGGSFASVPTGEITNVVTNASNGASAITFGTYNGSSSGERVRIDASGDVSVGGFTPAAKLDVGGKIRVTPNAADLNYFGELYGNYNSAHPFQIDVKNNGTTFELLGMYAASGGGNERAYMSVPLGVGTTSPEGTIHAAKASSAGLGGQIVIDNPATSAVGNATEISFLTDNGASGTGTRSARIRAVNQNAGNGSANLQFWTFDGTDAERARIDASGKFLVGTTTSPNQQAVFYRTSATTSNGALLLDGNGNYAGIQFAESGNLRASLAVDNTALYLTHESVLTFKTGSTGNVGGTERARITSGGYFKASNDGTYTGSTASYHEMRSDANNNPICYFKHTTSSNPYGPVVEFSQAPDNNTNYFFKCSDGNGVTDRLIIYSDGDVLNHDGTYGTLPSERRFKQDITDANTQWDDIKNIRLRRYRMISDVEAKGEDAPYQLGVIIDELEQVSPGLVVESPVFEKREVEDEDGNVTTEQVQVDTVKGWKTSIVHLKALKALQEAMARIEALEARLEALEA